MRPVRLALTAALVLPTTLGSAPPAAAEPGVDEPAVVEELTVQEGPTSINGVTLSASGRLDIRVVDRVARYVEERTVTAQPDGEPAIRQVREQRAEIPVCPDEDGRIEGTVALRVDESGGDGPGRHVEVAARVVATMGDDGAVGRYAVEDLEVAVDEAGSSLRMRASATDLPTDTVTVEPIEGVIVSGTGGLVAQAGELLTAAHVLTQLPAAATLRVVEGAADEGLCVRVEVDRHGITSLEPGASTIVDARVVDARTGEELDLPVEATPALGTVTPTGRRPAPVTFTFTAPDREGPYHLFVATTSRRGGHEVELVYETEASAWAFDEVVLRHTNPLGATITTAWSGYVCGDPIDAPWHFTTVTTRPGAGPETAEFEMTAFRAGEPIPAAVGTRPVVAPIPGAGLDEPPFSLVLDDVPAPGIAPGPTQTPVQLRRLERCPR